MKLSDIIYLAYNNLKQNFWRSLLTTLGVVVGIGSLSSMISFGNGLTENITKHIERNDIFTALTVTSVDMDYDNVVVGNTNNLINENKANPLNDKALEEIQQMKETSIAFAEMVVVGSIEFRGRKTNTNIKAIPCQMKNYKPFCDIKLGNFFESDTTNGIVISKSVLSRMGYILKEDVTEQTDIDNISIIDLEDVINQECSIITTVFDIDKIYQSKNNQLPIKDQYNKSKIIGIVEGNSFSTGMFSAGIFMPTKTLQKLPTINIENIYNFINDNTDSQNKYSSIHVRVNNYKDLQSIRPKIEKLGFQVFSIGDKLKDMEKLFSLLDSLLLSIGIIALFISALGIINTLMMAIYERRKEIGIMKSMGCKERQIRLIFYTEAAIIGFFGGFLGVIIGNLTAYFANKAAYSQIADVINNISWFSFSIKDTIGSLIFAIIVSILASLYPAQKASKTDPLEALRHE